MPNLLTTQEMFETLKQDFKEAGNSSSRRYEHINLLTYMLKFNVSQEDVDDYCSSLPLLVPTYSVCIKCHQKWSSLEKTVQPIANGHILDWFDSFEMWCSNEEHGTISYHQYKDNSCSFYWEPEIIHDRQFEVRWNCRCMVEECYGKNAIVELKDGQPSYSEYHILKLCSMDELPYTISKEQLYTLIKDLL